MSKKKKHPLTREQRLLLKKVKVEKKTKTNHTGKVRRKLLEPLQEQETENALHEFTVVASISGDTSSIS